MYHNNGQFKFLDLAIPIDAKKRGVERTEFSYPYVHDSMLWYEAIQSFIEEFINILYPKDKDVSRDYNDFSIS